MFSNKMTNAFLWLLVMTLCNVSCEIEDNPSNPCKEDGAYNIQNSLKAQIKENSEYAVSSTLGRLNIEIYGTIIRLVLTEDNSGNFSFKHIFSIIRNSCFVLLTIRTKYLVY